MTGPRIGSLFSGYGGLDEGVRSVIGGTVAWHCEYDAAPSKVLAHHWPDVPNLGDITAVDWAQVPPVDVLTGGFPCQDLSTAGKRLGLRPGTRSGLWQHMAYAINQLRPRLVVIENVRGILSAEAHSNLERDCWCVGDEREPTLRALGAVLGDLADLGYDARWGGVRASDAGAAHGRYRVFIVAHPHGEHDHRGWDARTRRGAQPANGSPTAADTHGTGPQGPQPAGRRDVPTGSGGQAAVTTLLPTPKASDGPNGGPGMRNGRGQADALPGVVALLGTPMAHKRTHSPRRVAHGMQLANQIAALLPTPTVNDMGANKSVEWWDDWTARMAARHGNNGHGSSLSIEARRLLPTPTAADSRASGGGYSGQTNVTLTDATVRQSDRWAEYAPAVARWADVLGRPAPPPTEPGKSAPRLSPRFVEWHMGLPEGHVTDPAIGLTHPQQLKALGNGVVPQQAAMALRMLLGTPTAHPRTHDTPRAVDHGQQLANQVALLPTPAVNDMGAGKSPQQWDEWTAKMQARHGNGNGHGKSLAIEALRMADTP